MDNCKESIIEIVNNDDPELSMINENKLLKLGLVDKDELIKQLQEDNLKYKEEVRKFKEDNIRLEGETKLLIKVEKENFELKEEIKELKHENKSLNERVRQTMAESNNKIEETKNDIIKMCDKQINFAQTVSKDSNKITSSAMTLLGFLQKQCPNAAPF